jgi:hypothetical protein
MKPWKFKLGVLLVFLLGVAIGSLGTGWWFSRGGYGFRGPRAKVEAHIMHRLSRYLDLNDEQKTRLRPVVHEVFGKLEALRAKAEPEIHQVLEDGLRQARPVLNDEQYGKLEKKYRDIRRKWQRHGEED